MRTASANGDHTRPMSERALEVVRDVCEENEDDKPVRLLDVAIARRLQMPRKLAQHALSHLRATGRIRYERVTTESGKRAYEVEVLPDDTDTGPEIVTP